MRLPIGLSDQCPTGEIGAFNANFVWSWIDDGVVVIAVEIEDFKFDVVRAAVGDLEYQDINVEAVWVANY